MIRTLVTGLLHAAPEARTGQSGKPYAVAKLKAEDKNGQRLWANLIALGAESRRLLALAVFPIS